MNLLLRARTSLAALLLLAGIGTANAAMVVYENVGFVEDMEMSTTSFEIPTAGNFKATLTDFEFPEAFDLLGFAVTTATEMVGATTEPGSFTFSADPGTYFANFVGITGGGGLGLAGVQISAVPLPAAAVLFSSSMLALVLVGRRRNRRSGLSDGTA